MCQYVFQLQSVHNGESPLQQRLGHLESDEIVILLRRITILRHLHHIESELRLQMRGAILRVPHGITVLRPQLGILDGNSLVDGRMAGDIRSIVRERTQGEGVLVRILALQYQLSNEVTAADVVHQIAEFHAAKGIVSEVLDDGASIGVSVRLLELLFRECWKALEKKRAELIGPQQVYDLLVGEHGVRERSTAAEEHEEDNCHHAHTPWAPATESRDSRD